MSKKLSQRLSKRNAPLRFLRQTPQTSEAPYSVFDRIDGRHPWQNQVTDGYVAYPVRRLDRGKVIYFNFALAKEMGLIPASHPHKLTPELTAKLLETFSIQIVNEYDQQHGLQPPKEKLKKHAYMATRYLQLQHASKQGRTSGDGRSVWNGTYKHKGVIWDISSRGTGVTCLAPGAVEANQPLKTGSGDFGYGCGLADVTELWGSAVMSEIFHLNGIGTERSLVVIDLGKGCGIGVRAAPNLIRPAHLFLYLKQGRIEPLRQAADYLIQREFDNGTWEFSVNHPNKYRLMLKELSANFAKFAARLEREYVFAWMDWDGDNVLASGGIIDYGSIRQFGLRHDQYKFDDVQRFSTNLNEQRGKARLTVQVFAQLVDFLETGKRKSMNEYSRHEAVRTFDRTFDRELRVLFLQQVGFDEKQTQTLLETKASAVEQLYSSFLVLEKSKTKAGMKRVADGVNRPAIFRMRAVLREMPDLLLRNSDLVSKKDAIQPEELLELMASNFAKRSDLKLKGSLRTKISQFQKAYVQLILVACGEASKTNFLRTLSTRAKDKNRSGRITGNASEFIVDAIEKARRRGLSTEDIQSSVELFIANQSPASAMRNHFPKATIVNPEVGKLLQELINITFDFEDDI